MRSLLHLRTLLLMVLGLLLAESASATHIRAGEITARRVHPQKLEYEITLWGYADTDSEVIFGSNGELNFGDGTSLQLQNTNDPSSPTYIPRRQINEDTWVYEFKVRHTFPSARSYRVSFREFYRNEGILNMDNSVNMPFYIETVIVIDPLLGINNTPQLLVPPVDKAAVGKVYIHNPGAFDIDGDSLSYRLVVVRQDPDSPVANYRYPQNTFAAGDPRNGTSLSGGEPTLTLDPVTGDLVWNTPGTKGEYNVAFFVEEWRKIRGRYFLLGYVTRDMQILVEDTENEPPVVEIPEDICVVAGENIAEKIKITDPDGNPVSFSFFGGPFTLGAQMSKDGKVLKSPSGITTPSETTFSWQTECSDVRRQPYQIIFRATDSTTVVKLTDIKTWNITVVAPPPAIESVEALGSRSISVGFDPQKYACQNASFVQVWRREGSAAIELDTCITGMPAGYGYELVSVQQLRNTTFPYIDKSADLKPGATYCYRLVMGFPEPSGGESLVSEEMCVTLPAKMPLITNVSILKTNEPAVADGRIEVKWVNGPDLSENEVTPPYRYDLYRSEGFDGGPYTLIASDLNQQEFVDEAPGLNTRDIVYNYYVMLKDASGVEFDSSSTASTVRLTPIPGLNSINLQWTASVPWSNRVQANGTTYYHRIYRDNVDPADPDKLVLIAEVDAAQQGLNYVDDGSDAGTGPLKEDIEYCYYVITAGSYNNPDIPAPLFNNSQKICSFIKDEVPPCPPLTFELAGMPSCEEMLQQMDCDDQTFENKLVWTSSTTDETCFLDLSHWEVYYSATGENYIKLAEVRSTTGGAGNWEYTHVLEGTMAGFYYIQAIDRSGNVSEASEIIMRDNCPNYWLPNVITRNGDNKNEELRPPKQRDFVLCEGPQCVSLEEFRSRCPRFVENVVFRVYNRWGKQVYEYNSATVAEKSIYINWDGRTSSGEAVSNGTYYYVVDVTYNVLDPAKRSQSIKGWVYVMDGSTNRSDTR